MNLPITLGLLLDTSGSEQTCSARFRTPGRVSCAACCERATKRMIISFDTDVDLLADLTDDRGVLTAPSTRHASTPAAAATSPDNPGPVPSGGEGRDESL